MSTRDGVSLGRAYEGQSADRVAQQLGRLEVDSRAFTFTNGCIGPRALGRVLDPEGDTEEASTLRTLLGLLREGGFIT